MGHIAPQIDPALAFDSGRIDRLTLVGSEIGRPNGLGQCGYPKPDGIIGIRIKGKILLGIDIPNFGGDLKIDLLAGNTCLIVEATVNKGSAAGYFITESVAQSCCCSAVPPSNIKEVAVL
ncbi:hypothetical protein D3C81_979610 [compost metagenome]